MSTTTERGTRSPTSSSLTGDNSKVVPTDTQKNTVFAFAKEAPPGQPEEFGLRLARHFVRDFDAVSRARVHIEAFQWTHLDAGDRPDPHAFERFGSDKRLATVTCAKDAEWVVSGFADLVVMKTTDSEFYGFPRDRYTTLEETHDRILATALTVRWRYVSTEQDWFSSFNLDAEQAPLRGRSFAVWPREPQRGLLCVRSALRAYRRDRDPRRRLGGPPGLVAGWSFCSRRAGPRRSR